MRAWLLGTGLTGAMALLTAQPAPRNTQVQATRQFLAAALRGDTVVAGRWLALELREGGIGHALIPLAAIGQRRGCDIELYKLGFLVGDGVERPFVTYAWAADSAVAWPERACVQVVFRDTASRQVSEVWLREMKQE